MEKKISIIIPSFNVATTITGVVNEFIDLVDEVIVVNNNSRDDTKKQATRTRAKVIDCKTQGMGYAIKEGLKVAKNDLIIKIDGDIRNPNKNWIEKLESKFQNGYLFVNSIYSSDYDEFPVGTLTARPALKVLFPELEYVKIPLSGTYIFDRTKLNWNDLRGDWSFDLGLLMDAHFKGSTIGQVEIGYLNDSQKKISEYHEMAVEILAYLIKLKFLHE